MHLLMQHQQSGCRSLTFLFTLTQNIEESHIHHFLYNSLRVNTSLKLIFGRKCFFISVSVASGGDVTLCVKGIVF